MNVKLLDLQAQYLPLRNEIRRAIDEVCDQQALIIGPHESPYEFGFFEVSASCSIRRDARLRRWDPDNADTGASC